MIAVLVLIIAALACALAAALIAIKYLSHMLNRDHERCVSRVRSVATDQHAAEVLEAAAAAWDSTEEVGHQKWLARHRYRQDGPTLPAIWLADRAQTLRDGEALTEHWTVRKGVRG